MRKKLPLGGKGENPIPNFNFKPEREKKIELQENLPSEPQLNFQENATGIPPTWQEFLEALKIKQERLGRENREQQFANLSIKSQLPIGIVLTSDWHLGGRGTDYDTWERHMELIKNEPLAYMIPLSNTIDNFIFPSGMFEQMENPASQQRMVKNFAEDFSDKILAIVGSNCHEGWTKKTTNIDPNYLMFEDNINKGIPWLPVGGVLDVNLNGFSYKIGLVHKARYNSSLNPTNPGHRIHDLKWPVDIVAIAHSHVKQVLHSNKYEGDFEKELIIFRTGAYEVKSDFLEGEGWGQGQIGSPIAILMPDRKHVIPFYALEDGIDYLRNYRKTH